MIDLSHSNVVPFQHQVVGVEWLTDLVRPDEGRIYPGCLMLADEMGLGKTYQTINAAQALFDRDEINRVVVMAPAQIRDVWFDTSMGELKKHLWSNTPNKVYEYHARTREWVSGLNGRPALQWIITNYEFLRSDARLQPLLNHVDSRTLLVCDESTYVKSHRSAQFKAALKLRKKVGRVWLLNGTPIAHSPGDLYAQAALMDRRILGCPSWTHFISEFAVRGGWMNKQILGWRNLEVLQARLKPYVLRRVKIDCLDLPPKLEPTTLYVTLTEETWKHYKAMRDELITWLDANTTATAPQAGARVLRLAQITSGFLGGLHDERPCDTCDMTGVDDSAEDRMCQKCGGAGTISSEIPPREIGREKLEAVLEWQRDLLEKDPQEKALIWCRFRPEAERLVSQVAENFPKVSALALIGGQKKVDRRVTLYSLHPDMAKPGACTVVGTLGTGSVGLNLSASHVVMYCSNDRSLFKRLQSMDRVHRPGQRYPVSYVDVEAVGPKGQKTIDHTIIKALREREELATWTVAAWTAILKEERR